MSAVAHDDFLEELVDDAGVEQFSEQEVDKKLLNFAKSFVNAPPDKRKSILESAEKVWGSSNDEHERLALEFISDLYVEADKRDGERRGA